MPINNIKVSTLIANMIGVYFFLSLFSNLIPILKGINSLIIFFALFIFIFKVNKYSKKYINLLLITLFILFVQSCYILMGQIKGYDSSNILFLSKYLIMFVFFPIIYYLIENNYLEKITNIFSILMLYKILIMSFIIINLNFIIIFKSEIFNFLYLYTNIKPYTPVIGFVRVFDSFAPFFPLVLFIIINKSKFITFTIHFMLFIYILYVGSVGIWISYFIILSFLYFKQVIIILVAIGLVLIAFFSCRDNYFF